MRSEKAKKADRILSELKDIDCAISTFSKDIASIEAMIPPGAMRYDRIVTSDGISDKTGNLAIKMQELREMTISMMDSYISRKFFALKIINKIPTVKHQIVLHKYYLQNLTLDEIAEDMKISYQWVSTLLNRALEDFFDCMNDAA